MIGKNFSFKNKNCDKGRDLLMDRVRKQRVVKQMVACCGQIYFRGLEGVLHLQNTVKQYKIKLKIFLYICPEAGY